jgi:DnaJ homolog subfamily C member 3
MRLLSLSSILILLACNGSTFVYGADSELYPPGLLPLINRANILLSTGQFNEAAKVYSEAIGKVPFFLSFFFTRLD